ncbi:unnamed protein product [Plutella xylostella]|uniref:(diamondback moth) hypothetical protein n=1 Tax=Plutella xylostella TaxID=51655 RepID=A0A8S4G6X5_PLUXY|nr:unnamed protein product [Plutella xylostella]
MAADVRRLAATRGDLFDFIVVGAGSAGAALAGRLAEAARWHVLLLEAGGDPPEESLVPSLSSRLLHSQYDWSFSTESDHYSSQAQRGGALPLAQGKMLGGTSSLNDMVYVRGNPEDYKQWPMGWDWQTVLPYFLKSENMTDQNLLNDTNYASYHSDAGPMKVSTTDSNDSKFEELLEYMADIGMKTLLDINGPEQLGASKRYFTQSEPPSVRSSTAQSFLSPIADRKNLFVLKQAYVSKIIINEDNMALGVQAIVNKATLDFFTTKEVIICAGAINTPKILIASGIGPKNDVELLGVQLKSDLPVGSELLDHIVIPLVFTKDSDLDKNVSYPMASDINSTPTVHGFISSDSGTQPDFQVISSFLPKSSGLGYDLFYNKFNYAENIAKSVNNSNSEKDLVVFDIVLLHPASTGYVRIKDTSKSTKPKIYTGYFTKEEDFDSFRTGINLVLNITNTTSFGGVNSSLVKLGLPQCSNFDFLSDDYWRCYILNMGRTAYDLAGTCAMGKVVDSDLKVIGINKLRVVDASVVPSLPSGNINAPVIMIAERAASMIKQCYI